jgi:cytochrome c1
MNRRYKQAIALMLSVTMFALSTNGAQAMLAPADRATVIAAQRGSDLKTVQTFLEQKQVREHLVRLGLNENEIEPRLAVLTDSELHQVATHIEQQNPAADGGGVVITVLVIGVLALLFVYLLKRV